MQNKCMLLLMVSLCLDQLAIKSHVVHVDFGMRTKLLGIIRPAVLQGHLYILRRVLHVVCCR